MLAERIQGRRVQILWTTFTDRNRTNREGMASQRGCDLFTQYKHSHTKSRAHYRGDFAKIKQIWINVKKWLSSPCTGTGLQFCNLIEVYWNIDPALPLCYGLIYTHIQSHFSPSGCPRNILTLSIILASAMCLGLMELVECWLVWAEATTVPHSWLWSIVFLPFSVRSHASGSCWLKEKPSKKWPIAWATASQPMGDKTVQLTAYFKGWFLNKTR